MFHIIGPLPCSCCTDWTQRNVNLRLMLFAGSTSFDVAAPAYYAAPEEIVPEDDLGDIPTPGPMGPYFETSASKNVTALVGKTAYLTCRVRNLGNRTRVMDIAGEAKAKLKGYTSDAVEDLWSQETIFFRQDTPQDRRLGPLVSRVQGNVSWVRHRDIHLLTVGRYTYTSDQRFQSIHSPHQEEWMLQVRYPQRRDSGMYECQVSTTPPIGHSMYLSVVEPITTIVGGPDMYINKGSTINLTCVVKHSPEPPPAIYWTHNSLVRIHCITSAGHVTVS
ncbi:hypothetical protein B566_EDAN017067 [Ephemera danica]|nr:hypothetical protein B566_EDAN017067 [Ephemera danica]